MSGKPSVGFWMAFGAALLALGPNVFAQAQNNIMSLERGTNLYWNGEYEATIDVLDEVCRLNIDVGERIECHKYLAFSYIAIGYDAEASEQFQRLLDMDPAYRLDISAVSPKIATRFDASRRTLADRLYLEGKAAFRSGDFVRAASLMEKTLKLAPADELAEEYLALSKDRLEFMAAQSRLEEQLTEAAPIEPEESPPEPENGVYRITSEVKRPVLLKRVTPRYPPIDLQRKIGGTVVLSLVIDQLGSVRDCKVVRSVSMSIDQAAQQAVKQWRYEPALRNGRPVAVYGVVQLTFDVNAR